MLSVHVCLRGCKKNHHVLAAIAHQTSLCQASTMSKYYAIDIDEITEYPTGQWNYTLGIPCLPDKEV